MKKSLPIFFLGLVLFAFGFWRFSQPRVSAPASDKIRVVASFYPLAFFAEQIGGERVEVKNLTPAGAEPHDFEPGTRDIAAIENSQLFLFNGDGFEPWVEGLAIQNSNVSSLAVAEGLTALQAEEDGAIGPDPHVWLDPVLAKAVVEKITAALIAIDPANQTGYEQNSQTLLTRLDGLDNEFRRGLAACRQNSFVTSHTAFAYLAERYGLRQVAIAGLSPDEEPTPQALAAVSRFAQENQVRYIFFETLVSPRLAETVAREVGAQTLVLNPLEGLTEEERQAGADYFSVQRANLENLKIALDCQYAP